MEQLITKPNLIEAAEAILSRAVVGSDPLGLILGSGLGSVFEDITDPVFIDYSDVPHMVPSTAPMHQGRFVVGRIEGRQVVCMQGRLHAYEGNTPQQIAFPVCLLRELGVRELIVTNAAGAIDPGFGVGDLMLIDDHINLLGMNPMAAPAQEDLGYPRFFDMTHAYSKELQERARKAAASCGIELRHGVYIATLGPSFETPAEIRAFRTLGADAVGMSTVFEVTAARACGMEVLGISMISNPAAGVLDEPLSMEDVSKAAQQAAADVAKLVRAFAAIER